MPYGLVISQHLSIELDFSVVSSDVAGGVSNGELGQQFQHVSGACLLTVELMWLPMEGWQRLFSVINAVYPCGILGVS